MIERTVLTEDARWAVAIALEYRNVCGGFDGLWESQPSLDGATATYRLMEGDFPFLADLKVLDRLAAEAKGWKHLESDGDLHRHPHYINKDNEWQAWISKGALSESEIWLPTHNESQAFSTCDVVGFAEVLSVLGEIFPDASGTMSHLGRTAIAGTRLLMLPPADRPTLLTAAAVIAARGN